MRILIADDHAVVRQGLKQILAEAFKRASFGEAENSSQALERVRKEHWDIVILDLTMPGLDARRPEPFTSGFHTPIWRPAPLGVSSSRRRRCPGLPPRPP